MIPMRNSEKSRAELLWGGGARRENVNSRTQTHNYSATVKRSCRVIAKAFSRDAVDLSCCKRKCLEIRCQEKTERNIPVSIEFSINNRNILSNPFYLFPVCILYFILCFFNDLFFFFNNNEIFLHIYFTFMANNRINMLLSNYFCLSLIKMIVNT